MDELSDTRTNGNPTSSGLSIESSPDDLPLPIPEKTDRPEFWRRLNAEYLAKLEFEESMRRDRDRRRLLRLAKRAVQQGTRPPAEAARIYSRLLRRRRLELLVSDLRLIKSKYPALFNDLVSTVEGES